MRTALEQGGVRFLFVDELAVGIIRADAETGARRIADSFNFKENHAPKKTDRPDLSARDDQRGPPRTHDNAGRA
jgi:hypothetical protein